MVKIKRATSADLNELVKMFDAYRVWYRKDSDIDRAHTFLSDRIENNESVIFIAVASERAIGFTQLYPIFSSTRMKRVWLLNDLFVSPKARGQGVSKTLLAAAQDHCRKTGACAVSLETEISNEIGNQLYPKMGFTLNESHNFYEWSNEGIS